MRPYRKLTPIEVRERAHTSFKNEAKMPVPEVMLYLQARINGEHCSVKLHNSKNEHIIIHGKTRTVHFYGTTGTVYAEAEGEHPSYRLRGASQLKALERAVALANVGY